MIQLAGIDLGKFSILVRQIFRGCCSCLYVSLLFMSYVKLRFHAYSPIVTMWDIIISRVCVINNF